MKAYAWATIMFVAIISSCVGLHYLFNLDFTPLVMGAALWLGCLLFGKEITR
jgi:hypothetical protein